MGGLETLAAAAVLVLVAQAAGPSVAQAAGTSVSQEVVPWVQVAGTSTIGGLLVYLITVYLPKRDDKIAEEMKAARLDYLKQSQEERALYREQGSLEREECERRHQEMMGKWLATHEIVREINHRDRDKDNAEKMRKAADELKYQIQKEPKRAP